MENIWLAASNVVAIVPAIVFYRQGCILQCIAVALAGLASFIYHLIECDKYGMPGVGIFTSARSHAILLTIDRACAVFAMLVCWDTGALMYYWPIAVIAFTMLAVSEIAPVYFNGRYKKEIYCAPHHVWHVCIFYLAYAIAQAQ